MPKVKFKEKVFRAEGLAIIDASNSIIEEYKAKGFTLTLRQLFYQTVAREILENTHLQYKRLGNIINDARLAGLVNWEAIEDRTRYLRELATWETPQSLIEACANQYLCDLWKRQPYRVEVWIEKDALVGVIEGVCHGLKVPFFALRGYNSQSEQWRAGVRFDKYKHQGQRPVILHLGDHDPSGLDMSRDNDDRVSLFMGAKADVRRLALNHDQTQELDLPPNAAKSSDTRFKTYVQEFGPKSWELDALPPEYMAQLVRGAVLDLRDDARWDEDVARQEAERLDLDAVAANWDAVVQFVRTVA